MKSQTLLLFAKSSVDSVLKIKIFSDWSTIEKSLGIPLQKIGHHLDKFVLCFTATQAFISIYILIIPAILSLEFGESEM